MVLFMRPTMATSPRTSYNRSDVSKRIQGSTKEVLEVLKNRVLASLIKHSEESIRTRRGVELQSQSQSISTIVRSIDRDYYKRYKHTIQHASSRVNDNNRNGASNYLR
jgi:hypothetical protein